MLYGAIYIAHNSRDRENIFKIGKTANTVSEHMEELTASAQNPGEYSACAYFIVNDIDGALQACHKRLHQYRVVDDSDFFELHLTQLIRIVNEEVENYLARNYIPDVSDPAVERKTNVEQLSEVIILESARGQPSEIYKSWNNALDNAINTIEDWTKLINNRVIPISNILTNEKLLKWKIAKTINKESPYYRTTICEVTLFATFTKEPVKLKRIELQGENYGDIDLSNAIGEVEYGDKSASGRKDGTRLVSWHELDDGRYGNIKLITYIENANEDDIAKEALPIPKLIVKASAIKYDNNKKRFNDSYLSNQIIFRDPDDAIKAFLSLITKNIKVIPSDIRVYGRVSQTQYSESIAHIVDNGNFKTRLKED